MVCRSFKDTAEPDTTTEQTRHTIAANPMMYLVLRISCHPPLNVRLNKEVVDEWSEHVHEQNRQHHAFWVGRVDDPNQHHHDPNVMHCNFRTFLRKLFLSTFAKYLLSLGQVLNIIH